jgi:hypothetical protein
MRALILAGLTFAISGCGLVQQSNNNQFVAEAKIVMAECQGKRLSGQVRGFVGSAQCSNPRLAQLAATYHYGDPDLVATFLAQRLVIAEHMDARRLTEAQGELEIAQALQAANETYMTRRRAAQSANAQTQAATAQSLLGAAAIFGASQQYYVPTFPRTSVTCTHYGNTSTCN